MSDHVRIIGLSTVLTVILSATALAYSNESFIRDRVARIGSDSVESYRATLSMTDSLNLCYGNLNGNQLDAGAYCLMPYQWAHGYCNFLGKSLPTMQEYKRAVQRIHSDAQDYFWTLNSSEDMGSDLTFNALYRNFSYMPLHKGSPLTRDDENVAAVICIGPDSSW
jgi:hypothetical protein